MRIYISGKVTGLPRQDALAKFERTKQELLKLGFEDSEIWNPMEHVPSDATWNEAMDICLTALEGASAIVMQKDWGDSKGACKELDVSIEKGIFFYFEAMGDLEMIRKEVLTNRFKIRDWGRAKV